MSCGICLLVPQIQGIILIFVVESREGIEMDKLFLLTYTCMGNDGFRHERNAWFSSEDEMKDFMKKSEEKDEKPEVDMAIEIMVLCQDLVQIKMRSSAC